MTESNEEEETETYFEDSHFDDRERERLQIGKKRSREQERSKDRSSEIQSLDEMEASFSPKEQSVVRVSSGRVASKEDSRVQESKGQSEVNTMTQSYLMSKR